MLIFEAYKNGKARKGIDLSGAYIFAQDGIAVRADIVAEGSRVNCTKKSPGVAGLAIVWDVGGNGKYLLNTTRLRERKKPYNLNLELARARIMRLYQKREDWGLFDRDAVESCNEEFDHIRRAFVQAMQLDVTVPAEASQLADEALNGAMLFGEKMALLHTKILTSRRLAGGGRGILCGTGVELSADVDTVAGRLRSAMDFITIPTSWRLCEPHEGTTRFDKIDMWMNWASREKMLIHAGPLLSLALDQLPEWIFLWREDFDMLRSLITAHVERVVKRYVRHVRVWNVASGLHCANTFDLNFDQVSELTRTLCRQVKKLAPNSQILIDMPMPWGEYYARNQRTVPPLLFSDMVCQNDMKFDAFGLQIEMGVPEDGHFVRDIMEISARLDEFMPYGKVLHITACQVPSSDKPDPFDAWGGREDVSKAGRWHNRWSPRLQAEWLQAIYRLAVSRGAVESICWRDLADTPGHYLPNGGLLDAQMKPKLAYKELRNFHLAMQRQNTKALRKKGVKK